MKPSGIQLIAEYYECLNGILNDKKALEKSLILGIKKCGLNLERIHSCQFNPIGVTVIGIISESHIAIHTYPEVRHASVDIFTCSSYPQTSIKLFRFFKSKFKSKRARFIKLHRGELLEIKQNNWITTPSTGGFEAKYHIVKRLLDKRSKCQQIDIIENDIFGRMLFLDNDLQIAEKDAHIYNTSLVAPLVAAKNKLGKVAILGGGDGGVLCELLKYKPKTVVVIDIDKEVIKASKKFLRGICENAFDSSNVKIIIKDANEFLKTNRGFDAIICDLTMHPELLIKIDRTTFFNQLSLRIKNSLDKRGMISLQCCSEYDTETFILLKRILPKHFTNIVFRKVFIPSFCENWIFASAKIK